MRLNTKRTIPRAVLTLGLAILGCCGLTGCHSHYIAATIKNNSGAPVTLVELDYPSASFGKDALASGGIYHYRFKIIGDGPTKLLWTDAKQRNHTVTGPSLHEGQEGPMTVTITGRTATWQTSLRP